MRSGLGAAGGTLVGAGGGAGGSTIPVGTGGARGCLVGLGGGAGVLLQIVTHRGDGNGAGVSKHSPSEEYLRHLTFCTGG